MRDTHARAEMSVAEAVSITRLEGSRWRFCGGRGGYGQSNLTHCIKMGSTFWTKNNRKHLQPFSNDANKRLSDALNSDCVDMLHNSAFK